MTGRVARLSSSSSSSSRAVAGRPAVLSRGAGPSMGKGRRLDTARNAHGSTDMGIPEDTDDAKPSASSAGRSVDDGDAVVYSFDEGEADAVEVHAAKVPTATTPPTPAPLQTKEEILKAVVAFAVPALISTLIGPILSMIDTGAVPPSSQSCGHVAQACAWECFMIHRP